MLATKQELMLDRNKDIKDFVDEFTDGARNRNRYLRRFLRDCATGRNTRTTEWMKLWNILKPRGRSIGIRQRRLQQSF